MRSNDKFSKKIHCQFCEPNKKAKCKAKRKRSVSRHICLLLLLLFFCAADYYIQAVEQNEEQKKACNILCILPHSSSLRIRNLTGGYSLEVALWLLYSSAEETEARKSAYGKVKYVFLWLMTYCWVELLTSARSYIFLRFFFHLLSYELNIVCVSV